MDVSIASLQDPLSAAHSFQQLSPTKQPMFDFLGANEYAFNAFARNDNDDDDDEEVNDRMDEEESPAKDFPVNGNSLHSRSSSSDKWSQHGLGSQ